MGSILLRTSRTKTAARSSRGSRRQKASPAALDEETGYVPSDREKVVLGRFRARVRAQEPSARVKLAKEANGVNIKFEHADAGIGMELVCEALSSSDPDFVAGLLVQLRDAAMRWGGRDDEEKLNFLLSVVKQISPQAHRRNLIETRVQLLP